MNITANYLLLVIVATVRRTMRTAILSYLYKAKTNSNFAEMLKEATIYFYLLDESHFSNICTPWYLKIECIEINWLCKHRKKVRSSQTSISINSCIELSKTVFPLSIVKLSLFLHLRRPLLTVLKITMKM